VEQVHDDNIGVAEQYRAPTALILDQTVLHGVHAAERTQNHRAEQARRAHPNPWRQTTTGLTNKSTTIS
jgi:hypothetical protein